MTCALCAGTGKLDYFEPGVLERIDMSGVKGEIDAVLGEATTEFAAARETLARRVPGRERDQLADRLEMAERLEAYVRKRHADGAKDLELMAWQGAKELENFYKYFAAEKYRDEIVKARRLGRDGAPSPSAVADGAAEPSTGGTPVVPVSGDVRTVSIRDFGAKGDGVVDDGEAFRKALASFAGKDESVVLKVPAGVYLVGMPTNRPETVRFGCWRDYGRDGKVLGNASVKERKFSEYGDGFHIPAYDLRNVTIRGEEGTEIRFLDASHGGFGFYGCTETVLEGVNLSYRDNPSTQGKVIAVEENPFAIVFRRERGFPDPDEPRFLNAHSRRFSRHVGPDLVIARTGTARMGDVKRLTDDTFRFVAPDHQQQDTCWRSCRVGDWLVVIARYSESAHGFPVYFHTSSFSGLKNVRIYDAPGQSVILASSFALFMDNVEVKLRPGTNDLLTSNADGMMGSGPIGPYVVNCRFEHMEDDGINISSGCAELQKTDETRTKLSFWMDGAGVFQVDGVTGKIKDFIRRGKTRGDVLDRPLVSNTVSVADLKTEKLDPKEWLRRNSWQVKADEKRADRFLQIPSTCGAVVKNTLFRDLRGMGVQVHCSNMMLDGVKGVHLQGPGACINPLFGWGMMYDVHNVLVRNCDFRDVAAGLVVKPGCVAKGLEPRQKMIQGIAMENNRFAQLDKGNPAVSGGGCHDLSFDGMRWEIRAKQNPVDAETSIRSEEADDVRAYPTDGNGSLKIEYRFVDGDEPVRLVTVTLAKSVSGEDRWRIAATPAKGWHLAVVRFPILNLPLARGGDPSDDCLITGTAKGGYCVNPAAMKPGTWMMNGRHPGQSAGQFAASWDGDSGVYIGMEDTAGNLKEYGFQRTADGLIFYNNAPIWTDQPWELGYPVVVREVKRGGEPLTWYDFADIYRDWDRRQSWSRTPYLARTDIPAWMKDAPAFVRFSRQWLERPDDLKRFVAMWKRELGDMPVVAALWGWEKHGTWWGPDYFPCHPDDATFKSEMAHLRANRFHPFAWPSGYNWSKYIGDKGDGTYERDFRKDWIDPNEKHICVNPDGKLFHMDAFWLRNGALTTVCGGDPWTQNWWNDLTRGLAERGCDLVQVDQVVGGRIRNCWSTEHGHPVGPGAWLWPAFRRQLESMQKALRAVQPDGVVGVEETCELMNDIVGIQDYRDMETYADHFADVFGYLYHGYVPLFQSNTFRDEMNSLVTCAVNGQIPFVRPDFAELDETRPALQNGGFENLVDSVRGPGGWDRLIPGRLLLGVDPTKPLWNFTGHNNMGWLGYSVTLDFDVKHSGAVSLKFDPPVEGGRDKGAPMQVSQTVEELEPGEYTVSAWVKSDDPSAPAGELKLGFTDSGEVKSIKFPVTYTGPTGVSPVGGGAGWVRVSGTVKVRDHLRLIIWAPPGARFHVDDLKLERNGAEVMVCGDSKYMRFMKRWIALYRGEGREFLADGFRIKPPRLDCSRTRVAARVEPAVIVSAYRNAKGKTALVFGNPTGVAQTFSYRWQGRFVTRTIAPGALELVWDDVPAWFAEYRGDYGALRRERAEMRLEAMRRLEAITNRDVVMEAELAEFRKSFVEDLAHWRKSPLNPAVKSAVLDMRDFGAKGDGVADDAPAFAAMVKAARELKGVPVLVKVPKGVYYLGSPAVPPTSQKCNLDLSVVTNLAFVGEDPATTRFEFGNYDLCGVSLYRSANVALQAVSFRWRENPFSQLVVEDYNPKTGWVTGRWTPGTLKPTDPRYRTAARSQCVGFFTADRHQDIAQPTCFFDFQAEDLGEGRFKVHIDTTRPDWQRLKLAKGQYVILPDRSNRLAGTFVYAADYPVFDRVWFYNARSSALCPSNSRYSSATRCRTIPFSDELVFSSNADTHYCARGSHLAHCEFRNMNDDGANCLGKGGEILARVDDRTVKVKGGFKPRDVLVCGNSFSHVNAAICSHCTTAGAERVKEPIITHVALVGNRFSDVGQNYALHSTDATP